MDAQLAALPADIVAELRRDIEIQLGSDRPDTAGVESPFRDAVAAGQRELDRQFAAEALRKAFHDLDLDAEDEFTTLLVREGVAYVRDPSWSQHAVRVRLPRDGASATFNVVRDSEYTSSADDVHAETTWCSSFDRLEDAMQAEGVAMTLVRHVDAGELPLPAASAERLDFGRKRASTKANRSRGA